MRRCVFCSGEIPAGAPPEHVLPKWLEKFRPKDGAFRQTERPEVRGDISVPPRVPEHVSKRFDLVADTICPRCNHGWMSDLENEAAGLLTEMIEGRAQGLTIDHQVIISRWVTKTVLTWDQSQPPERRLFPLDCCRWLHDHQLPPPGSKVRLGHYRGESEELVQMICDGLYSDVPADQMAPGRPNAHRALIRIGALVMELLVAHGSVLRETGDIDALLLMVWPAVEVCSWPPRTTMTDEIWSLFVGPDTIPRRAA